MVTAALIKNLSHYSAIGHISLAVSVVLTRSSYIFQDTSFPWPWREEGSVQISLPTDLEAWLLWLRCIARLCILYAPHTAAKNWWVVWILAHDLDRWRNDRNYHCGSLGSEMLPYSVIDVCACIHPVLIHTYLMRGTWCRSRPDTPQSPFLWLTTLRKWVWVWISDAD